MIKEYTVATKSEMCAVIEELKKGDISEYRISNKSGKAYYEIDRVAYDAGESGFYHAITTNAYQCNPYYDATKVQTAREEDIVQEPEVELNVKEETIVDEHEQAVSDININTKEYNESPVSEEEPHEDHYENQSEIDELQQQITELVGKNIQISMEKEELNQQLCDANIKIEELKTRIEVLTAAVEESSNIDQSVITITDYPLDELLREIVARGFTVEIKSK